MTAPWKEYTKKVATGCGKTIAVAVLCLGAFVWGTRWRKAEAN